MGRGHLIPGFSSRLKVLFYPLSLLFINLLPLRGWWWGSHGAGRGQGVSRLSQHRLTPHSQPLHVTQSQNGALAFLREGHQCEASSTVRTSPADKLKEHLSGRLTGGVRKVPRFTFGQKNGPGFSIPRRVWRFWISILGLLFACLLMFVRNNFPIISFNWEHFTSSVKFWEKQSFWGEKKVPKVLQTVFLLPSICTIRGL